MPIETETSDGVVHEFPDGTDRAVIDKAMKAYALKNTAQPSKYAGFVKGQLADTPKKDTSIALSNDPNKEYGIVLPYAIDKRTGKVELAFPQMVRGIVQDVDLLDQERRGQRPVAGAVYEGGSTDPMNPSPQMAGAAMNVAALANPAAVAKFASGVMAAGRSIAPLSESLAVSRTANPQLAAAIVKPLAEYVTKAKGAEALQDPATREIILRMAHDAKGGGPTAQDMLDLQVLTPNKPLTLADLSGENVRDLAGKLARAPGESKAIITRSLLERDKGADARVQGDINDALGQKSAYEAKATLDAARSAAAEPLYAEYRAHPPMNPDEMLPEGRIGSLLSRPSMKVGLANAIKIASEKGVSPNTLGVTLNEAGEPIFLKTPTWETIDFIKAGLDDVVETYRDKTSGKLVLDRYGRAANDTRSQFLRAVDSMNPKYKPARDSWAGPSQSRDAITWGRGFDRMEPEEIADRVSRMSPNDKEFAKLGVAQTLRKMVMKTGKSGDESRKIAGNEYIKKQLRPFFDDQQSYDKFISSVDAEGRMFGTNYDVLGNSKTAARTAVDSSPMMDAAASGAKLALSVADLNPLTIAKNSYKFVNDIRALRDPERNAAMARILAAPLGPGSPGMRVLSDFAKISPQTKAMLNPTPPPAP